ncbi:unnamed protein product [Phytophthora fragariaefolia]|uniref:Unnamed protein product n=1 Tax=Phytophthora fragariaefolia TaxID=1490495 RepID=A0A9W6XSZ5_9STRA|nr:unnamed protein product [Phytophthora fragariaefolia]
MQHPRHTASSPATNPTYAVPPNSGSSAAAPAQRYQEASEKAEIRDLIGTHKPHLLTYHLESRRAPTSAAKRTASTEDDSQPGKRGKFSFAPLAEQRRVHDAITSDTQRGKSASEFVESLVSSSELWAYPGVATRAYDIEFGSRGLSFLRFAPADPLLRLRCQRESIINVSDFYVLAKFMPAPDPASWGDVLSGANGFQQYCFTRCDPATPNLATTLSNFVVEL